MTLRYGKYDFTCRLEGEARLPFYKGSTFRGLFGLALKKIVCALRLKECRDCLLHETCLYCAVFDYQPPAGQKHGRRSPRAPHPFVIEPPLNGQRQYQAGEPFACSLILFGNTNEKLPYFVYAFEQMGRTGIGARVHGERGRFVLEQVRAKGRTVYTAAERKLVQSDCVQELEVPELPLPEETPATDLLRVRVHLQTPLRLKYENRLKADLPFHVLARAMLRRISVLFGTFGGGEPKLDYTALVHKAQDVRTVESDLTWLDWERYSSRQNTRMFMGGMLGSVTYEGELQPYLLLLDLCEKVHIGKQTTFGMGKIRTEVVQ